ncbi:MAG TPA: hypothetical protein VJR22_03540 [Candidatus Nitrosotalea sp.]|nr:hypothetical protein [Nitrososphaerota archaeon]HKU32901.1 hypothetical protein [Candidatus Nitrosotalea sp.]
MQIPSNSTDPFVKSLSEKGEEIRQLFLVHVQNITKRVPVKVMLGDGTVSDQESFDPTMLRQFYDTILKRLADWITSGVSSTTDQDLRRSFIKFEVSEGNYVLSCHMSLQYHALLFYKPDHRVIDIQKELSEISDKIKHHQENMVPKNDKVIEEKLKQKGYENMDQQKLFEILFEQNDLTAELTEMLQSNQIKVNELTEKQVALFKELDNLLIEIYHTTSIMIDEMRMIGAEEGCLCIFNLEYLKGDIREGNINVTRISTEVKDRLLNRMNEIVAALKF